MAASLGKEIGAVQVIDSLGVRTVLEIGDLEWGIDTLRLRGMRGGGCNVGGSSLSDNAPKGWGTQLAGALGGVLGGRTVSLRRKHSVYWLACE